MNQRGEPKSWRHYVYGMNMLTRKSAADTIDYYRASASAFSGGESAEQWLQEVRNQAGWV